MNDHSTNGSVGRPLKFPSFSKQNVDCGYGRRSPFHNSTPNLSLTQSSPFNIVRNTMSSGNANKSRSRGMCKGPKPASANKELTSLLSSTGASKAQGSRIKKNKRARKTLHDTLNVGKLEKQFMFREEDSKDSTGTQASGASRRSNKSSHKKQIIYDLEKNVRGKDQVDDYDEDDDMEYDPDLDDFLYYDSEITSDSSEHSDIPIDPIVLDGNTTFDNVGGLEHHITKLKEMIVFPLVYPEIFDRFSITPPRGVLFYGPPGTGKSLLARALANECSSGSQEVAFFMRKGADCLNKWQGESERQLRVLFQRALELQPSIIFFDEIDGLAPIRSSQQDQIHNSMVTQLLTVMDSLGGHAQVVVIGATNRIDAIDPALRRPGRFDREFLFPLPSLDARKDIISIHTKDWNPPLTETFKLSVATTCVGYCGADIRALCTEAVLAALQRHYPEIYMSNECCIKVDANQVTVGANDFTVAMNSVIPAAQRTGQPIACPLQLSLASLLQRQLDAVLEKLRQNFPSAFIATSENRYNCTLYEMDSSGDDDEKEQYCNVNTPTTSHTSNAWHGSRFKSKQRTPSTYRHRLLMTGRPGQGHIAHIAPAILSHLEHLKVVHLDLPTIFGVSSKNPEEAFTAVFREARRALPSVIYIPHIEKLWGVLRETVQATFLTLLNDIEPHSPLLILATSEQIYRDLVPPLRTLFSVLGMEVYPMSDPTFDECRAFVDDMIQNIIETFPGTFCDKEQYHELNMLVEFAIRKMKTWNVANLEKLQACIYQAVYAAQRNNTLTAAETPSSRGLLSNIEEEIKQIFT